MDKYNWRHQSFLMLQLPGSLQELLAAGRWPRNRNEEIRQNLTLLVSVPRIKQLAPEEESLYLLAPPFHTVAERAASNKYWLDQTSAPSEIDFELALDIGDFGPGSDAPILLDYRTSQLDPRVLRLRWSHRGIDNHWVETAPNFKTFALILGLLPIT
jgi:hypothetical protein